MESQKACELHIYMREGGQLDGLPLYEALVHRARDVGLAGATVYRSPMGYGADTELHSAKILRLNTDLPVILEIVDYKTEVEAFLSAVEPYLGKTLVTLKDVEVRHYS